MTNQKTERINELEAELYTEAQEESRRDVTNPERAMAKIIDVKSKEEIEVCKDDVLLIYEDGIKLTFKVVLDTGEETEMVVEFPEDDMENLERVKDWCDVNSLSGLVDEKIPVKKQGGDYVFPEDYRESLDASHKIVSLLFGFANAFIITSIPNLLILFIITPVSSMLAFIGSLIVLSIFGFAISVGAYTDMHKDEVEPWEDVGFKSDI